MSKSKVVSLICSICWVKFIGSDAQTPADALKAHYAENHPYKFEPEYAQSEPC